MQKIAVLPDLHVPFHDAKALDLFIKVIKDFEPDILVCLGDFGDFKAVSRYDKKPDPTTFMQEMLSVNRELDKLNDIAPRKIFLSGNHEHRLDRYLIQNSPELYGIVSVEELLELSKRGWEYYPYQDVVTIGNCSFVHDLGFAGVNATRQMSAAFPGNIVFGHTHRLNCFTAGNLKHNTYTCWNSGWLGDPKQIDYLPSVKVKMDWVKGFILIHQDKDTYFTPIKISNNRCFYDGKVYVP